MKPSNQSNLSTYDVVILGGGMVGLSLANQLIERGITTKIAVIDKESTLGKHSSGRNSGVLHAGIYYKPNTLKARVCVDGARRLKQWIRERNLELNLCGKVIVPTKEHLDPQLDVLKRRGEENGAQVEMLDETSLQEAAPEARSASGRAIWSPNTAVVKPLEVVKTMQKELKARGVSFYLKETSWEITKERHQIILSKGVRIGFGHLFNCAGLQADYIAHQFNIGKTYSLMPFKGLYWQIKKSCSIQPRTNIYPVPDLAVPFLGVHFTPSAGKNPVVSIGPTAIPAWGRENYNGIEGIQPTMAIRNAGILISQYIYNKNNFRRYVHEQAFLNLKPLLLNAAKELIPAIKEQDIEISPKIAIRSQLFNHKTQKLEDDFLSINGENSTHILNAISPAFTASFALADLILERAGFVTVRN